MAQESNREYYEMAKEIAKIEKELQMERWVRIGIHIEKTRDEHGGTTELVHLYDLPDWVATRRDWVIRWRAAKIQCQNPKRQVTTYRDYYRRIKGEDIGMQKDIDTFIAAKAAVTRQRNNLERYLAQQRQDLFFDEEADQNLKEIKEKIAEREKDVRHAEWRLKAKVDEYMATHNTKTI